MFSSSTWKTAVLAGAIYGGARYMSSPYYRRYPNRSKCSTLSSIVVLLGVISGVALIAKFCVNIAFFGCCMHFSHIAASPYAKWQHRLNKPYASLVDAGSLNTRSTCKLSVISAVQVSQWRAEFGQRNKHVTGRKLPYSLDYKVTVKLSLKAYPWALTPCLWIKCSYFSDNFFF